MVLPTCTLTHIKKTLDNLYAGPVGYCSAHGNKYQDTNGFTTGIYNESWVNSDTPLFTGRLLIMWTQAGHKNQFVEISFVQIGLFIANLPVL